MLLFFGKAAFFGVFLGLRGGGTLEGESILQNVLAYPCC
jgi:hypothetical protein